MEISEKENDTPMTESPSPEVEPTKVLSAEKENPEAKPTEEPSKKESPTEPAGEMRDRIWDRSASRAH